MNRQAIRGRAAFTTIELLVVISIIAILMALTTAGVMKVKTAARRAQTANEIGQLGSAVGIFKREKRIDFIPSRIMLRERMDYNSANGSFESDSANYLKQVWGSIPIRLDGGSPYPAGTTPGPNGIDWNGDGTISANPVALEGDQCLVFFLGGIPRNGGMTGFSSNPRNPADTNNAKSTFDFPAKRLKLRTTAVANYNGFDSFDPTFANGDTTAGANGFPSFADPFEWKPYLYYSSYGRKNGYSLSDCATLNGGAYGAYLETSTSFKEPNGFQIISAGYDKAYGIGGIVGASTGGGSPDADNVTNFSNGQIGGN